MEVYKKLVQVSIHWHYLYKAYAWGFDIRSWQRHLNPLTWPEILRQFALSAGFGPKLKKRSIEQAYLRDENEGNDGEDIISNLRNGAAAENALAIMQERGFSNPRRSRHRLTPGTVKFAAFHVLSLEGSNGLTILEVAEKIQKSGLRDLTTSKTPEASIAAALSRDSKLFERTAPSTYCVRTPYRKDPVDTEAILSAAREKIQIFKNGYLDGEDAEDVEPDDVERDEDSESDIAEDPDADDLGTELKPNNEALSCEANRYLAKTLPADGKDTYRDEVIETPEVGIKNLGDSSPLMQSEGYKEVKSIGASVDQSIDVAGICNEAATLDQEDTVIDESNSGEPWVQGLMEGEYSDLSVEEHLSAVVALIGVANEGNSIRIILEECLEAANALKKQMWAEVQLDKCQMKEEYVMKIQYPSYISDKTEPNVQISSVEGRQSPLPTVDDKNGLVSTNPVEQKEHLHDAQNDQNYPIHMPTERNPPIQEASTCTDNLSLLQPGYAAERSRSQLKAYIGHKAEEMYVYRSLPLGQDRRRNRYWQFITSSSRNDPGSGRIFVKLRHGCWRLIDSEEGNSDIDQLGKIFAAFGTPKPSQWPDIKYLPDYVEYQYVPGQPLRQLFPMASADALDLLSKMFTYDPKARISALQALEHRYFSSGPPPTEPALLPRPPPKKESLNSKVSDFNIHEGPTVLSPPRKSRRVMPNHEGFEGNEYQLDDAKEGRPAARERTEHVPMPLDFSVFGSRPPTRPTINSADRSHLKRKLDLEFQLPEEEDEE